MRKTNLIEWVLGVAAVLVFAAMTISAQQGVPAGGYNQNTSSGTPASIGAIGPVINMGNYINTANSYYRHITGVVTYTSGSPAVSCASACFNVADGGKSVDCYIHGDSVTALGCSGATFTYISSTSGTLSVNASHNAPGNSGSLAFYHDDSVAAKAAWTAACAATLPLYIPPVPNGMAWVTPPTGTCITNQTQDIITSGQNTVTIGAPPSSSWSGANFFPYSRNVYGGFLLDSGQFDFGYTSTHVIETSGTHEDGIGFITFYVSTGAGASVAFYSHGAGALVTNFVVQSNVSGRPIYNAGGSSSIINPYIINSADDSAIKLINQNQTIDGGFVEGLGTSTDGVICNEATSIGANCRIVNAQVNANAAGIETLVAADNLIVSNVAFGPLPGGTNTTMTSVKLDTSGSYAQISNSQLYHGSSGVDFNLVAGSWVIDGGGNSCLVSPCTFSGSGGLVGPVSIQGAIPTIVSGFGSTPSATVTGLSPAFFLIAVGGGGTAQTGVVGMPPAKTGWNLTCQDITTQTAAVSSTKQIGAGTSTQVTIGNFSDLTGAGAWAANDVLQCAATAY